MPAALIEELPSPDRSRRARLLRREDGLVEVVVERQVPGDGLNEPPYWSRTNRQAILTDTVEAARKLAREELGLSAESP